MNGALLQRDLLQSRPRSAVEVVAETMEVAMKIYQIGAALMAAAASLIVAGVAQAEPRGAPSALLCRTEAGVETLYAFHGAHPEASLADGVAAVNATDASAGCGIVSLIYEVGEIVATVRVDGNGLDIRKVSV